MKMNKKGFTIVELVIVIAVIAILAGVMIPTFGGVIDNANKTTALQEANNIYKQMAADINNINKGSEFSDAEFYIVMDGKYVFEVEDGAVKAATTKDNDGKDVDMKPGDITLTATTAYGDYVASGAVIYKKN